MLGGSGGLQEGEKKKTKKTQNKWQPRAAGAVRSAPLCSTPAANCGLEKKLSAGF